MAKTEAQKQAQLKYLAAHPRKRLPVDMLPADYEKMIAIAKAAGVPPVTYIKRAISAQSGVSFSWDASRYQQDPESIEPDEWDLAMIERAKRENDKDAIGIEDLAAELGVAL